MLASLLAATIVSTAQAPSVLLHSFLSGGQFYLTDAEPKVRFGTLQIGFAPEGTFTCQLLIKEGERTVQTVDFRMNGEKGGVFTSVSSRIPGSVGMGTSDGPRRFEVMVNGSLAGKFEFNLKKTSGGDPLDPKTTWIMTGPWKDHAFIKHKPDDGYRQDLIMVYFVGLHELKAGEPTVVATLKKGATVVATGDKRRPAGAGYSRFEQTFVRPNRNTVGVKDLATMSGLHTVELRQGTNLLKSWTFTIANGAITPHPLSDHTKADPLKWLSPRTLEGSGVSPFLMHWLTPK